MAIDRTGLKFEHLTETVILRLLPLLGVQARDARVTCRARRRGVVQPHEIDILIEHGDQVILVECKDHQSLQGKEVLDAYFSFVDVAKACADKTFIGVLVSSMALSRANISRMGNIPAMLNIPPNLGGPVRLLTLSTSMPHGVSVAYEYVDDQIRALVVPLNTASPPPDVEAAFSDPSIEARLAASVQLIGNVASPHLLHAHIEAATCLLHLGASNDAALLCRAAARLPEFARSELLREAAQTVGAMAEFQTAARIHSARTRPGQRAVRRLSRASEHFGLEHRASALTFVGAYEGIFGDRKDAHELLLQARSVAIQMGTTEGEYQAFIADFRRAELSDLGRREDIVGEAAERIGSLEARHSQLAVDLLRRLDLGEDCSIRSSFRN